MIPIATVRGLVRNAVAQEAIDAIHHIIAFLTWFDKVVGFTFTLVCTRNTPLFSAAGVG